MGRVDGPEIGIQNPGHQARSTPTNPGQQAGAYASPINPGQQAGAYASPINSGQQAGAYAQSFQTGQALYVGNSWNKGGLFDCHDDPTNGVMTFLFPCVTFGQIAEVLDATDPTQGSRLSGPMGSLIYLIMLASCTYSVIGAKYRTKLRKKYGLVEAPYTDMVSHIFCPCCSLSQEYRELKSRDLDPALGWQGILARQQSMNQPMKQPPPTQSMS